MNKTLQFKIYKRNAFIVMFLVSLFFNCLMFSVYNKYREFDRVMIGVTKISHQNHTCLDFSNKLVSALAEIGIQSRVVIGESPKTMKQENIKHAWVEVWFEPQTGNFTNGYK